MHQLDEMTLVEMASDEIALDEMVIGRNDIGRNGNTPCHTQPAWPDFITKPASSVQSSGTSEIDVSFQHYVLLMLADSSANILCLCDFFLCYVSRFFG